MTLNVLVCCNDGCNTNRSNVILQLLGDVHEARHLYDRAGYCRQQSAQMKAFE